MASVRYACLPQTFRRRLSSQWQCRMLPRVPRLCHSPVALHGYRPNKNALICAEFVCTWSKVPKLRRKSNMPDVKCYLCQVTIGYDGLLVIRETSPLRGYLEHIVVLGQLLVGLITAIHIKFNHPSSFQTKRLMNRYFLPLIWTKL